MLNWTVKGTANTRYRTLITQVVNFSSVNFWACLNQSLSNLMEGAEQQTVQSSRQGFSIAALLGTSRQQPHRPKPERALHGQQYSQEYPHSLGRVRSSFDVGSPMYLPRTLWESSPAPRGIAHQGTSSNIGEYICLQLLISTVCFNPVQLLNE